MNFLKDVITYVRRIVKSPSNAVLSDNLIVDYINRFWIMDVDARMQLFDLKTKYQFQTVPGVDRYNMPLYSVQSENIGVNPAYINGVAQSLDIGMYPVYQGFLGPAYVNGVQVAFETQKNSFFNAWPNIVQYNQVVATGDGTAGPYTLSFPIIGNPPNPPNPPLQGLLRGHIDIAGVISTGVNEDPPLVSNAEIVALDPLIQDIPVTSVLPAIYFTSIGPAGESVVISDSGQFLDTNVNYGLLMQPGKAPFGNLPLAGGGGPFYSTTQNTINYFTGVATNVYFPATIAQGQNIIGQCFYFQTGLPRGILYYNNTLTLRAPPDTQYLVEIDAYLSPCSFFNTEAAIPFAYMAEYIARGAARKLLSDTGDVEQFMFYEPLFREQENLVWKRSQRQWTSTRTHTLYSQGAGNGWYGNNNNSGGGAII
jgi:hypothetical protein